MYESRDSIDYEAAGLIVTINLAVLSTFDENRVSCEELYASMVRGLRKGVDQAISQGLDESTLPIAIAAAALVKIAREGNR